MLSDGLVIRRATAADAASLAAFGAAAFRDTFGGENTPEDMAAYLSATYDERQQRAEIASAHIVTLIVEQEGSAIAFAQVRRGEAPACVALPQPVEIWRFYVARAWHGTGLAQVLMRAALDAGAELGGASVWLSVWERNARGIRFYAKCGFSDVGSKVFVVGSDRQTDRVMARGIAPA
jgi:diamine N-acetyltransferase